MTRVTIPNGATISVTDTQLHLNRLGVEPGVAAMNAVGVERVLIDEWWGWDHNQNRMPNYSLPSGTIRYEYPIATEACVRHPDRFGYYAWVDRHDPDLDALVASIASNPYQRCIRVLIRADFDEDAALEAGDFDRLFAAAGRHNVPLAICLAKVHLSEREALLAPRLQSFGEVRFVLDHCGILPLSEADADAGRSHISSVEHVLGLAKFQNVYIKWAWAPFLSRQSFPFTDVQSALRSSIDAFGAHRIMWASDHTQTKRFHTWAESLYYILCAEAISDAEKEWVLGKTAEVLFDWPMTSTER